MRTRDLGHGDMVRVPAVYMRRKETVREPRANHLHVGEVPGHLAQLKGDEVRTPIGTAVRDETLKEPVAKLRGGDLVAGHLAQPKDVHVPVHLADAKLGRVATAVAA